MNYSASFEAELDACTTKEEMMAKVAAIIAAHWDGKSKPTAAQYRGGRILGGRGEWLDIMDVMRGRRKVCLLYGHTMEGVSVDHNQEELMRELAAEGLHVERLAMPVDNHALSQTAHNGTQTNYVVCKSPASALRAQLILEGEVRYEEFRRALRYYKKPEIWLDNDMESVITGLLLGFKMCDVMFFLHRIMCDGGCLAMASTECKHLAALDSVAV